MKMMVQTFLFDYQEAFSKVIGNEVQRPNKDSQKIRANKSQSNLWHLRTSLRSANFWWVNIFP